MNGRSVMNFDNSAGTYPKPVSVRRAVDAALREVGGNPGRSGHALSMKAAQQIYNVRRSAAEFFGAQTENTAFVPNCTYALNMVIKGLMQYGGHIIISCYEHNSVSRPVYALTKNSGVKCSIAKIYDDTGQTIAVTGFDDYDLLVCIAHTSPHTNGRHVATVRLVNLAATSNVATKTGTGIATSTEHYKLSSSGTLSCRVGTTPYGVYVYSATLSTSGTRTITFTIYERYNSTSTGTLNGHYHMDVYGVRLRDML